MPPGPPRRHVAVVVAVGLLLGGCTVPGDRVAAVEGRLASLEGRMVAAEDRGVDVADAVGLEDRIEKTDFRASLDAAAVQASLDAVEGVQAEVVALELDAEVDLVKATIRPVTGDEAAVAWQSAKALAPLFATLTAYAPALDLQVGATRCICSTELMKGIARDVVDRDVWDGACSG